MENNVTNEEILAALEENTEINKELLKLLKQNNIHTKEIYEYTTVQLSTEQQIKDFGINIAANLIGNSVTMPNIIDLQNLINK